MSELDINVSYLEALNDKSYMQFSGQSKKSHTHESQLRYIKSFDFSQNALFSIKRIYDNALVGSINYFVDFSSFSINLGFLIFRDHAGKGYATEALEVLLPYLEGHFPDMEIVIGTHEKNLSMQKIALKAGFKEEAKSTYKDSLNLKFTKKLPRVGFTSIPYIPSFVLNATKIGVVAFDAGGGEQISWLLQELQQPILVHLGGPARALFERSQLKYSTAEKLEQVSNCDLIMTGSGWMTNLELSAIDLARKRGIPCLTILDHWINFRERFQRAGQNEVLPQFIGVTNSLALQKAQKIFPNNPIWLLPDFQIVHHRRILSKITRQENNLLVVLEPPSHHPLDSLSPNNSIERLIEKSIAMKITKNMDSLIVRLHPSQSHLSDLGFRADLYADEIKFSNYPSLLEDLTHSSIVVGISSYALYIASMCGLETYSSYEENKDHWTNHFPLIQRL